MQITARSDRDLTPEAVIQKVADSSGSRYSAADPSPPVATATKPAVASKPVFTPTQSGGGAAPFASAAARARVARDESVDADGWGEDAPPVTRTQLEKVPSAYKPTKVSMRELTSQQPTPPSYTPSRSNGGAGPEPVRGAYQPVGKVDIAAIRREARDAGALQDDRPGVVKGAYEPVGKVDIAAIRGRAQKPDVSSSEAVGPPSAASDGPPRSLADRSTAFTQSERLTSLPKPKVSSRFGGGTTFTGTKAPAPGGFEAKPAPAAAPVGAASRTFADEGGKTPAQIWAEKKARERGQSGSGGTVPISGFTSTSPVTAQTSGGGEWKSGYTGKTWAPVQTTLTGKSAGSSIDQQRTGDLEPQPEEEPASTASGVSFMRDRFSGAPPMGAPASNLERSAPQPDMSSKPNRGVGVPIPGLPVQQPMPTPPPQPPRTPTPPTPEPSGSPIRVAVPVGRGGVTDVHEEQFSPPPTMPVRSLEQTAPADEEEEPERGPDPARATAEATAAHPAPGASGQRALVQYDYEQAEDNEIELKEGDYVTHIEMVDADWWVGQNARGETGLFPSNYVELVDDDDSGTAPGAVSQVAEAVPIAPAGGPAGGSKSGRTATAVYDYEAGGEVSAQSLFPKD